MAEIVPGSDVDLKRPAIIIHPDGVYIGLSPETYHKDPALGSGGIKDVKADAPNWWWLSAYNTLVPNTDLGKEPDAYHMGTAVHVAMLDSNGTLDAYDAAYLVEPSPMTHPKALVTDPQIRRAIEAHSVRPVPGTKADRIRQLVELDPEVEILDLLLTKFAGSGKRRMTFAEDATVRLLHRMIMRAPTEVDLLVGGGKVMLRDVFGGGLSEVSVFWTDENGIRQKARFDKLWPNSTVDLKTFADWRKDNDFGLGLLREIVFRGYMLQAAHYEVAREELRRLVAEGLVFGGDDDQRALLDEIAAAEVWAWLWVFAITQGAPRAKAVRLSHDWPRYTDAVRDREEALAQFVYYRELYGLEPGDMWIDPVAIWEPEAQDFPIL